jgi:hypothetical protein
MSSTEQPPKVARWILNHFGSSPNNPAVIGDLDERYNSGSSAGWYWKQVVVAVVVSFFKEIWEHKFRATIAVLTGWVVLLLATSWLDYFLPLTAFWLLPTTWKYPDGWMILVTWATFAATGWFVAKTQRSDRSPMVLVYAISFIAWAALQISFLILKEWRGERPTGAYPIWLAVLSVILECASILFGGGLLTTPKSPTSNNSPELKSNPV